MTFCCQCYRRSETRNIMYSTQKCFSVFLLFIMALCALLIFRHQIQVFLALRELSQDKISLLKTENKYNSLCSCEVHFVSHSGYKTEFLQIMRERHSKIEHAEERRNFVNNI